MVEKAKEGDEVEGTVTQELVQAVGDEIRGVVVGMVQDLAQPDAKPAVATAQV
jgi:hypothetical protein